MGEVQAAQNPITSRVAENVRRLRKAQDMSRREFGERIGRSAQNIMYWETERSEVSQACMSLMASVFGLDPFWFFESHDNSEQIVVAAHQLPDPPPDAPAELVNWVKAALKAARDPLTQIEHDLHSNVVPLYPEMDPRRPVSLYGSLAPQLADAVNLESYPRFQVPF